MRHAVIIGSTGQLGTDLAPALAGLRVTGLAHADLDVEDAVRARDVLTRLAPDVVINTSAFHKVDVCEDEPAAQVACAAGCKTTHELVEPRGVGVQLLAGSRRFLPSAAVQRPELSFKHRKKAAVEPGRERDIAPQQRISFETGRVGDGK